MIDEQNCFDHPVNNYQRTYDSIQKIASSQGDDYISSCLLDYNYFKYCQMIVTDLTKQQALDADSNVIQQINFTGNLDNENTTMFFII